MKTKNIKKTIDGFKTFFNIYSTNIEVVTIETLTKIQYSNRNNFIILTNDIENKINKKYDTSIVPKGSNYIRLGLWFFDLPYFISHKVIENFIDKIEN